MFAIKVCYNDVTRRIVFQEFSGFDSLFQIIVSRFEMSPVEVSGAQLQYIDPDGDLISLNTDAELREALELSSNHDGQPILKMKLFVNKNATYDSDTRSESSVVVVDPNRQSKDDDEEEKLRAAEEEKLRIAEEAKLRIAEEEKRRAAEEEKLRVAEEKRVEEEKLRVAEEEKRRAAEDEKLRVAEAEEGKRLIAEEIRVAEEERVRAEQIASIEEAKARERDLVEMKQRCEIALCAELEDSQRRVLSLRRMGCSIESLKSIFSESFIYSLEKEFSSEEVSNGAEGFVDCVDEESGIYREQESELKEQPEPEPVVDWEMQKNLTEDARNGVSFPSPEQTLAVIEAGNKAKDLATQLTEFYLVHNPENVSKVPELVKNFKGRESELNKALMNRYRCDLSTFRSVASTAVDESKDESIDEERPVSSIDAQNLSLGLMATAPSSESVPVPVEAELEAMDDMMKSLAILAEMGIDAPVDRQRSLLEKHNFDITSVMAEIFK